jgi:hypothetical protein
MAPPRAPFPMAFKMTPAMPGHVKVRGLITPKGRQNGATIYSGGQPAFYEWVDPQATSNVAAGAYDIVGNQEHDRLSPLWRADGSPGASAQLHDDSAGLWLQADVPEGFDGQIMLIANGTSPGLSMEFWAPVDGSQYVTGTDGLTER